MNDTPASTKKIGDFGPCGTTVQIAPAVGLNLLALWSGAAVLAGSLAPLPSPRPLISCADH